MVENVMFWLIRSDCCWPLSSLPPTSMIGWVLNCWLGTQKKFPGLSLVWADSGYIGKKWSQWAQWFCGWTLQIVKRTDNLSDFKVVPRRWVVERTFAWLDRHRRLSKDYEVLPESSKTRCQIAMIRLLLRRLANNQTKCYYPE